MTFNCTFIANSLDSVIKITIIDANIIVLNVVGIIDTKIGLNVSLIAIKV